MKNNTLLVYLGYLLISGLLIFSGCIPKKEILPRTGTYTFYNNYSDNLGTVTVTVDGTNIKSFSNTSDYCNYGSSYSSYYYTLSPGSHTYKAQSSDLTRTWSGSFTVYENYCGSTQFYASSSTFIPGTIPGTNPGTTGSNTITDSGGLKIDLTWSLPGTSLSTTYADLELQIETSSSSSYSSSTSSSSFESLNFPSFGTSVSSLANGTYYVSIRPYSISSSYSYASYSIKFTGVNTGTTYTYNSTTPFYYSSSNYTKFIKIVKSGSSFTLSLY